MLKSINYLRYPRSFDYSKVPIIKTNNKLNLDPRLGIQNEIDELRIANFMMNPPRPRQIPEVDLVEQERMRLYGEKVDISPETLYERFKGKVIKVPRRDADGKVMKDVTSNQPLMRFMTWTEMLNDGAALLYRIRDLITLMTADYSVDGRRDARLEAFLLRSHLAGQQRIRGLDQFERLAWDELDRIPSGTMLTEQFDDDVQLSLLLVDTNRGSAPVTEWSEKINQALGDPFGMLKFKIWLLDKYEEDLGQLVNIAQELNAYIQEAGLVPATEEELKEEPRIDEPAFEEIKEREPEEFKEIDRMFKAFKFPLPNTGNVIDKTWYDHNITHGRLTQLNLIISRMLDEDMNVGAETFVSPHNNRVIRTATTISNYIRNGQAVLVHSDDNTWVLRATI